MLSEGQLRLVGHHLEAALASLRLAAHCAGGDAERGIEVALVERLVVLDDMTTTACDVVAGMRGGAQRRPA